MSRNKVYTQYLKKTFLWVVGNTIFGLAPLLFMCFVRLISGNKIGNSEIDSLIHEGAIPFLCCAIMGAIAVEFLLSGYLFRSVQIFAIYLYPLFILSIISIDYLFISLRIVTPQTFNLSSETSIFVIILSFGYCLFAKTKLYIKEGIQHEQRHNL
jgi:hypothetical protein